MPADSALKQELLLIVDDVPENIQILEGILGEQYRIKAALNGEQALQVAFSMEAPDLILLDIMMPGIDGYQVCSALKSDPQTSSIPVIFVTTRGEVFDETKGFEVGAIDYLTKPVVPQIVKSRVQAHLAFHKQNRDLERKVAEGVHRLTTKSRDLEVEIQYGVETQLNLARTLDLLSNVVDSASSAILAVNLKGTITFANTMAARILEVPEVGDLGGRKLQSFPLKEGNWQDLLDQVITGAVDSSRIESAILDEKSLFSIHLTPLCTGNILTGAVIIAEDIAEKKNLELQLLQSSKMATLGEMATGIAHEINQPLNVIRMAAQLIQDSLDEGENDPAFLKERAEKIIAMVVRAARIINHLRTFGRKNGDIFTPLDPNQPVREAVELLTEKIRLHSVNVFMDLAEDLPEISGDMTSLEQVFLNLLINSIDAFSEMPEDVNSGDPRRNRIELYSRWNDETRMVEIKVVDNGPGVPDELLTKVFEPFFTTKEVGKGTGLGLSISYGIVESHGGSIHASRREDTSGSVFQIELPGKNLSEELSEVQHEETQNTLNRR
ncbi:MAG: response regulator [bacterium]|nr:response regulator [bacterium]